MLPREEHEDRQDPAAADAHRAAERDAVDREMAHQERTEGHGGQRLTEPLDPKDAAPSPPIAPDMPSVEPMVDTTHWPDAFRRMLADSVRLGEHITHESREYEIVGSAGGHGLLVTDVGEADMKPVYYKHMSPEGDEGKPQG